MAAGRSRTTPKSTVPTRTSAHASSRTSTQASAQASAKTSGKTPTRTSSRTSNKTSANRTSADQAKKSTKISVPKPADTTDVPVDVSFTDLGLPAVLVTALAAQGVQAPFPIQAATLPHSLAGRDLLGRARTGSGKTYAFALPVLARLSGNPAPCRPRRPRALILAPTRELASQIEASIAPLATALSLRTLTVFGGVSSRPQISGLRAGIDILVACPGRLADLITGGHVHLDGVEITVLDEADHMADLGFLPEVRRLLTQTPRTGQRLLFSATLDKAVEVLVRQFLRDPVTHSVDSTQAPGAGMAHHVFHVRPADRLPVLVDLAAAPGRTLVFTRTKRRAKTLTRQLVASGVRAVELHGNLDQPARTRNLAAFSDGTATTLVATDIAARGIHIDDVALVIHADPPAEHKAYLHRSGRTARAGAEGTVITLMTDDQVNDVRDLTRKAGITPRTTKLALGDPLLRELVPGKRTRTTPAPVADRPSSPQRTPQDGKKPPRTRTDTGRSGSRRRDGKAATSDNRTTGQRRTKPVRNGTPTSNSPAPRRAKNRRA